MPTYHPCLLIYDGSAEIDRIPLGTYRTVERTISATIYALVKRGLLDIDFYLHMLQENMPDDKAEEEWSELHKLTREFDDAYDEKATYKAKKAHFLKHTRVYAEYLINKTRPIDVIPDDLDAWRLEQLQNVLSEYGVMPLSYRRFVEVFRVEVEKKIEPPQAPPEKLP